MTNKPTVITITEDTTGSDAKGSKGYYYQALHVRSDEQMLEIIGIFLQGVSQHGTASGRQGTRVVSDIAKSLALMLPVMAEAAGFDVIKKGKGAAHGEKHADKSNPNRGPQRGFGLIDDSTED